MEGCLFSAGGSGEGEDGGVGEGVSLVGFFLGCLREGGVWIDGGFLGMMVIADSFIAFRIGPSYMSKAIAA